MTVSFVGAGPGDPGLLTIKGAELLRAADIVITEKPWQEQLLTHCRADVRVIDGRADTHAESTRLVVEHGKTRSRVVRLLEGDPLVYGLALDELPACIEAGIEVEVVPGVSSLTAAPAAAGVPVGSTFTVLNALDGDPDWDNLGGAVTFVLVSAVRAIGHAAAKLIAAGRAPETPVTMIHKATHPDERILVSTLEHIAADVDRSGFAPPAITVVGQAPR